MYVPCIEPGHGSCSRVFDVVVRRLRTHQERKTQGFAEDVRELFLSLGVDGGGGEEGGDAAEEEACAVGHAMG